MTNPKNSRIPRRRSGPTPMTRTIGRLVARLTIEQGEPPTDDAVAKLLAISVPRVRMHRALIAMGAG